VSLLPGWARRPLRLPRLPVTETVLVRPAGHAMVRAIRWATSAPPPVPKPPRTGSMAHRAGSNRTNGTSTQLDRPAVDL
jgi:hypothetical protein